MAAQKDERVQMAKTLKFRLKVPVPPPRLKVRVNINKVCPPTAAFPRMMAIAAADSKPPTPALRVRFKKPLQFKATTKKHIIGKKTAPKSEIREREFEGTLFHWGGEILLVCHRSPWHPSEWFVSEYTTGLNVHWHEKPCKWDEFHAGQRPTEAEARFEAIYNLQRYGITRMKAYFARCKKRNKVTPKMRRYVDLDWNGTVRDRV